MIRTRGRDLRLKVGNIKIIDVAMKDIEIGERFRKSMGNIEALAQSISKEGLIHPIAIAKNSPEAEQPYKLLAGGRRFRALEFIRTRDSIDNISCRIYDREVSELELRLLEFAENLYRKDLGWQEDCDLKERIHLLQQKIHGVKFSTAKNAPGWSLTDMVNMTGRSKGSLSEDLGLAKMMRTAPEINWEQFKTKEDAKKALKTAKKKIIQTQEAKKAKATLGTGESLKKRLIDSYHVEDFFEGIKRVGNSTMDFVELDPPYAIDLENQKKDYSYSGYNEINPKEYSKFMNRVFSECYRVLKPNSWLICWLAPHPWFELVHQWLIDTGFSNKRMPGIWVKGQGQAMQPDRSLANAYEMFFYARKGSPTLAKPGSTNIFTYSPVPSQLKVHPTERPIEMIADVITTFAQPNSNILVPFAGSGNTLIAAAQNNMLPVGFDLTDEYFEGYIIKCHKQL